MCVNCNTKSNICQIKHAMCVNSNTKSGRGNLSDERCPVHEQYHQEEICQINCVMCANSNRA